jgi:hypothetical protein
MPPLHPAAALFPEMDAEAFAALVASIAAHGQLEPCVLLDGQLLDGRHRWRACLAQRPPLVPQTREWAGEGGDPVRFVLAQNLHRRHLDSGQRAVVAAESLALYQQQAKERQREAGKEHGRGQPAEQDRQGIAEPSDRAAGKATAQAAKAAGTNAEYVRLAARLRDERPDLFADVKRGDRPLVEAVREARREKAAELTAIIEAHDPDGRIQTATLVLRFSEGLSALHRKWFWQDVALLVRAHLVEQNTPQDLERGIRQTRQFLDRLEAEIAAQQRIRLVEPQP